MLSNVMSIAMLPSPVSVFGTLKSHARLHRLHAIVEIVDVIARNLRSSTEGSGSLASAERSLMNAHHEGHLTFFAPRQTRRRTRSARAERDCDR